MNILVIEDDYHVQQYILKSLKESGHEVQAILDGKQGLHLACHTDYDLLIIDRMLPSMDGLTILRALRTYGNQVPILMLTALGDVEHKVEGLRSGADDYLVKPFSCVELLARIEALYRRNNPQIEDENPEFEYQNLFIDFTKRYVVRNGKKIILNEREFKLLEYLLKYKGQLVTRTMLLEAVWDYRFDPQTNVIDVHISRLRKKILDPEGRIIKTVRGSGYMIEVNF